MCYQHDLGFTDHLAVRGREEVGSSCLQKSNDTRVLYTLFCKFYGCYGNYAEETLQAYRQFGRCRI